MTRHTLPLLDRALLAPALASTFHKLDPRIQFRNPVMFVVYIGSLLTTGLWLRALSGHGEASAGFIGAITIWLWFTVLFANFAEALAEGRSKAQAASLRSAKKAVMVKKLREPRYGSPWTLIDADDLRKGDVVEVLTKEMIPCDGEVIEGAATVDESAITGESAPVIRESGGDFCSVTGGTTVMSDWLVVRCSADPGDSFFDRMIALVEGAKGVRHPMRLR